MAELEGAVIERKRGDTAPDVLLVKDPANPTSPLNITGFSYKLTLHTLKSPTTEPALATITGTITDAPNGRVEFPWTAPQADQTPGKYWYDIQQTDAASRIKTIAKNRYVFYQDITKV